MGRFGGGFRVVLASQYPGIGSGMSSGVEGVAAALADGLARRGIDTHVVTCVKGLHGTQECSLGNGVKIHYLPSFGHLGWLVGFPLESRRIRKVIEAIKPEIVHCHTQTLYAQAALERGWPSVLTIHGVYSREAALMPGWRGVQGRLLVRFEKDAIKRARHIVCINEYIRDELGDLLRHKDVRLIENPVDDRFFEVPDGQELPGQILYAGSITKRKNLLQLLEAVYVIKQRGIGIRLRVAGSQSAEPDYFQRCAAYIRLHGIEDHVYFLGMLSLDDMLKELARASVVVLTSLQETAPMVVSEAMAAGKPVVVTPAGGTARMIADGESGFVVPFNDALRTAEAIERLLANSDLRREIGQRAKSAAGKRHRLSTVVEKTVGFYEHILSKSK